MYRGFLASLGVFVDLFIFFSSDVYCHFFVFVAGSFWPRKLCR